MMSLHVLSLSQYGAATDALWSVTPACIFKAASRSRYDISQVCTARMTLELVFIRSGNFKFNDSRDSVCLCLKLSRLFSFYVPANFYHLLLCVLRVRAS